MGFEMVVRTADGCPIAWTRFATEDMGQAEDTFAQWRRHPNFSGGPFILVLHFGPHLIDTHHYGAPAAPVPAPRTPRSHAASAWLH